MILVNKALIRQFYEALSGKEKPATTLAEFATDKELVHHIELFEEAFPRYELIADDMVAEGDRVSVRARFRGLHKGDLMGIAPTGKQVELPFQIIYRIADGKIVEHWMSVDQLALIEQVEFTPAMA